MKRVLLIGGCKQSGKSSAANFITGYQLKAHDVIDKFHIEDDGSLWVNSFIQDEEGNVVEGMGELDLARRDSEFVWYAQQKILPYCKINNIADPLKESVHTLFGVPIEKLYGSDEDKSEDSGVPWKNVAKFRKGAAVKKLQEEGKMDRNLTIRELLMEYGDACRTFDINCFVRPCISDIVNFDEPLTIVPDCRFINEIEAFQSAAKEGKFELKMMYFTKKIGEEEHESEQLHNRCDVDSLFDAIIDNNKMTVAEKNQKVLSCLLDWGWVKADMG